MSLKFIVVAALLFTFTECAGYAQAAENLLRNGDFEGQTNTTGTPVSWKWASGQTPTILNSDQQEKKVGAASLRFDLTAQNNTGWIEQQVDGIHPDTQYQIKGFIKTAPDAKLQLQLEIEPNLQGMSLPAATEWIPWEMTFNSSEATVLRPQFRFRGAGRVWLDDIQLVQTGKAGADILPGRVALIKQLQYQANPVDPKTNTDVWTKPYRNTRKAGQVFTPSPNQSAPTWKVGQWARYLCRDELLVPSTVPEKRPHIALIDCAIVGEETHGGKKYFWYQSVVRLDKYWVAKSMGLYDSTQKILLDTDRKIVLTMLVDGPRFKEVRRYQLKVDGEPLLEYSNAAGAVLPWMNIDHALIKPAGSNPQGAETQTNAQVPVTGLLSFVTRAPQLDRTATLVNWGQVGAKDEREMAKPVVLKLAQPPYFAVAFDGFGDLKHFQEMADAGVELFEQQTVLYLGEARQFFNQVPAYFFNGKRWDVDIFDVCRSNFMGFSAHLDEPYQRQWKKHEYVKREEASTLPEAADRYSDAVARLLQEQALWPGGEIKDYNSPTAAAWYSARAGVPGFLLENARLKNDVIDIQRVTSKQNARALADEINIGFMSGAAKRFGIWWGQGLYDRWVPEEYWQEDLVYYAQRGAKYLGFWIVSGPAMQDPDFKDYQKVRQAIPAILKAVKSAKFQARRPGAVIVVPYGSIVALSGSPPDKPWGLFDYPQGKVLTDKVITRAAELFDKGITFDIVVDDPKYPPVLTEYEQVIRVTP